MILYIHHVLRGSKASWLELLSFNATTLEGLISCDRSDSFLYIVGDIEDISGWILLLMTSISSKCLVLLAKARIVQWWEHCSISWRFFSADSLTNRPETDREWAFSFRDSRLYTFTLTRRAIFYMALPGCSWAHLLTLATSDLDIRFSHVVVFMASHWVKITSCRWPLGWDICIDEHRSINLFSCYRQGHLLINFHAFESHHSFLVSFSARPDIFYMVANFHLFLN